MPGIFKFVAAMATMAVSASAAEIDTSEWWEDNVLIMDKLMAGWGYSYEPYTAVTDDDWTLTVFRITG